MQKLYLSASENVTLKNEYGSFQTCHFNFRNKRNIERSLQILSFNKFKEAKLVEIGFYYGIFMYPIRNMF